MSCETDDVPSRESTSRGTGSGNSPLRKSAFFSVGDSGNAGSSRGLEVCSPSGILSAKNHHVPSSEMEASSPFIRSLRGNAELTSRISPIEYRNDVKDSGKGMKETVTLTTDPRRVPMSTRVGMPFPSPPRGGKPFVFAPRPPPGYSVDLSSTSTPPSMAADVGPSSSLGASFASVTSTCFSSSSVKPSNRPGRMPPPSFPMKGTERTTGAPCVERTSSGNPACSDLFPGRSTSSSFVQNSSTFATPPVPFAPSDSERRRRLRKITNGTPTQPNAEEYARKQKEEEDGHGNEEVRVEEPTQPYRSRLQHSCEVHGFVRSQYRRLQKELIKQSQEGGSAGPALGTEWTMPASSGGRESEIHASASFGTNASLAMHHATEEENTRSSSKGSSFPFKMEEKPRVTTPTNDRRSSLRHTQSPPLRAAPPRSPPLFSVPRLPSSSLDGAHPEREQGSMDLPASTASSFEDVRSSSQRKTVQKKTKDQDGAISSSIATAITRVTSGTPLFRQEAMTTEEERLRVIQRQWRYLSIIENGGREPIPPHMKTSAVLASASGEKIRVSRHSSVCSIPVSPSTSLCCPSLSSSVPLLHSPSTRSRAKKEAVVVELAEEVEEEEDNQEVEDSLRHLAAGTSSARDEVSSERESASAVKGNPKMPLHHRERSAATFFSNLQDQQQRQDEEREGMEGDKRVGNTADPASSSPPLAVPSFASSGATLPSPLRAAPALMPPPPLLQRRRKSLALSSFSPCEGVALAFSTATPIAAARSPIHSPLLLHHRRMGVLNSKFTKLRRRNRARHRRDSKTKRREEGLTRRGSSCFSSLTSSSSSSSGSSFSAGGLTVVMSTTRSTSMGGHSNEEEAPRSFSAFCSTSQPAEDIWNESEPLHTRQTRAAHRPGIEPPLINNKKSSKGAKKKKGRRKKEKRKGSMKKDEEDEDEEEGAFSPRYVGASRQGAMSSSEKYPSFMRKHSLVVAASRLRSVTSSRRSLSKNKEEAKMLAQIRKKDFSYSDPQRIHARRETHFDTVDDTDEFSSDSSVVDDHQNDEKGLIQMEEQKRWQGSRTLGKTKKSTEESNFSTDVVVEELDMIVAYPPSAGVPSHR